MKQEIIDYHQNLPAGRQAICDCLYGILTENLASAEHKLWHGHPVWFINGNPIVGYSSLKGGIRLLFWSGADFNDDKLRLGSGKFKDASITYAAVDDIDATAIARWLSLAETIQWDYKNLIKHKGELRRIN